MRGTKHPRQAAEARALPGRVDTLIVPERLTHRAAGLLILGSSLALWSVIALGIDWLWG